MAGPSRVLALLRDPRTGKLPKAAVALAVAYLLWPADLVPELAFPVVGFLDDITALWLSIRWLVKHAPPDDEIRPLPPASRS